MLKNEGLQEGRTEDIYFGNAKKDSLNVATLFEVESNVRTTDKNHFQVSKSVLSNSQNFTRNYNVEDCYRWPYFI